MTAISRLTARSTEALAARCDLEIILMATFSPDILCMPSLTRPYIYMLMNHGLEETKRAVTYLKSLCLAFFLTNNPRCLYVDGYQVSWLGKGDQGWMAAGEQHQ